MSGKTRFILSLDGGGIRGVFSAHILEALHNKLNAGGSRPLAHIFDLIAGTSTGGILALGLAVPSKGGGARYTPSDLKRLYTDQGGDIFPSGRMGWLRTLRQVIRTKYTEEHFEQILDNVLGETRLSEALTNVLITSYDTARRVPHYFRKPSVHAGLNDLDFYMKDAARATSAAPTFFRPHRCKALGDEERIRRILQSRFPSTPQPDVFHANEFSLIDGGIYLTNPSLTALMEMHALAPESEHYVLVSIGTGKTNRPFAYNDIKSWGAMHWVGMFRGVPILSMMMDGQSDNAEMMLQRFPKIDYFRFDTELVGANDDLDDASTENIANLLGVADHALDQHATDLERLASMVDTEFVDWNDRGVISI